VTRLHGQLQRTQQHLLASATPGSLERSVLDDLYEDIHWLLLVSGQPGGVRLKGEEEDKGREEGIKTTKKEGKKGRKEGRGGRKGLRGGKRGGRKG